MRRRIVICLTLLFALCLLGNAIALVCLKTSIRQLSALAESHRIQSLRAELASSGIRLERDLLAALDGHRIDSASWMESLDRFERSLAECGACHHEGLVQAGLDRLMTDLERCRVESADVLAADPVVTEDLNRAARGIVEGVAKRSADMAHLAASHLVVMNADAAASVERAWTVLSGTLVVVFLVGGLVAFHLMRRVTRPLEALVDGVERIRNGDLSYRFAIEGDEEFRDVGRAFNQANESLKYAQEGILQAEKMAAVGKLAAGIAHEVGNPLASISAVAQMMRRHCDSPTQAEQIDLIMQHIARVSRVVRELLTFSRPPLDNNETVVEINRLLDHAVALLRYDRRAGKAEISCSSEAGLTIANGDADRLMLVFTNIMVNAFDAMSTHRNGDARLIITARRLDDRIVVKFEDNGPGMTQNQIKNAFEPFFTTKEPGSGTGLGLWICYQVVRKHEGCIRIDSTVGQGTTVHVELPCERSRTS